MRKKNMVLVLVMVLVIGFATVSTTLYLNGTIGITTKKDDFDVIFTKAILDGVENKRIIDSTTRQTITYTSKELTTLNDTTTLQYEVTNKSRLYDAEVSVECNIVDASDNPTTSEYITMEYTPTSNKITVEAGKTETGSITARLKKVSANSQEIKVKCELKVNSSERTELGEEYIPVVNFPEGFSLKDANDNGTADIGEEIQVGTESFYVISNENNQINALAKYNLNVGSNTVPNATYGIQNELAKGYVTSGTKYGNVAFSDNNGWPYANNDTINIKDYDGPVKEALYGANGYEKHIQKTIPTATVRLIEKAELEGLGCSSTEETCKKESVPSWVYSTSYWTQSASSDRIYGERVWYVYPHGVFDNDSFYYDLEYGVRPVITISYIPTVSFAEGYDLRDANNNGETDIGEEIQVGTESFYVISKENNQINALAKYNLNVGDNKNPDVTEGIQHETVRGYVSGLTKYGNVKFSNNNGWPYENNDTITIKDYDGPVKEALYGANGYENYIKQTIPSATVRLIEKTELEGLGCSSTEETCKKESVPNWVYSTSYWTQSADSGIDGFVWSVNSNGRFYSRDFEFDYDFGVRPVITISEV